MKTEKAVNKYLREYYKWLRKNKLKDSPFNWFKYNDIFMMKQ